MTFGTDIIFDTDRHTGQRGQCLPGVDPALYRLSLLHSSLFIQ